VNNFPAIASKSAPVVIRHDGAVNNLSPIGLTPSIRRYLRAIGALALECADRPELLADFVHIIAVAPATIETLRERRAA
jgi:hypothetical protein